MLYAIISEDVKDSLAKRKSARTAHLERLNHTTCQCRRLLAGPHASIGSVEPRASCFSGSLIVAEFTYLHEAQAWADADPYIEAGVYEKVTVKPFKKVLP